MNEQLMNELFEEAEDLLNGVMKQSLTFYDISSMSSEELEMFKKLKSFYEKSKELSLSMARTLDRQNEVLKRLDGYLDHQDYLERQKQYQG